MQKIMRFSMSGMIGLVITASLFVGMLHLLDGDKPSLNHETTDIRFSFVQDYQPATNTVPDKPEKPEPQEVIEQPAMPQMPDITHDAGPLDVVQKGIASDRPNLISGLDLPGIGGGGYGHPDQPGMIKNGFAPLYPRQPLMNKTEGWVKLLIQVNEFGQVSDARVLDAEPARVFNNAALKAVRKWTFHPKTLDGKGVPFQVTQTIEFTLNQ